MRQAFGAEALAIRDLGLREAEDPEIFSRAREAGATVMTKDRDFVDLLERYGPPPQIVWLTCGNTTNAYLRELLMRLWPEIVVMLAAGEPLVEVGGGST